MPDLQRLDWDFSAVPDEEVMACTYYEFARESPTIVKHYANSERLKVELGLGYRSTINGKLLALPNPLQWLWPINIENDFAATPWQSLLPAYRRMLIEGNKSLRFGGHDGVSSADSVRMAQRIISRGNSRSGIDEKVGIERIAIEIDWAAFDDAALSTAFSRWIKKNRPTNIGFRNRKGKAHFRPWRAKLKRLSVARLLAHCPLCSLQEQFPDAWEWLRLRREWGRDFKTALDLYEQGQEREIYRCRELAVKNFRELFPFLPHEELPSFHLSGK